MKIFNKYFCFLSLTLLLIPGCIDETNYPEPMVSGTVYDMHGFPATECSTSVINYPIAVTNEFGRFELENVLNPYDLTVNYNTYFSVKYLRLKNTDTKIYYPVSQLSGTIFKIKANFPLVNYKQALLLKFICDENPFSDTEACTDDSTAVINIYFKNGYGNTRGTLIILLVTYDDNGFFITSYDAYSIKNITLSPNTINTLTFTEDDFLHDIPERTMNFSINLPPGVYVDFTEVSLHFSGMDKNSDMRIMRFYDNYNGQFRVPVIPGLNYKIKTENQYYVFSPFSYDGSKFTVSETGENISINHNQLITLAYSGLYRYGVWDTTEFIADNNETGGIYLFTLSERGNEFEDYITTVFTDKNRIKFKDFYSRGFIPKPYYPGYSINVKKLSGCNTIDEFTSGFYVTDDKFSEKTASNRYLFYTGP